MKTLLLEDDPNRARKILDMLPDYTKWVMSARHAIKELERDHYDLIMLDHDLEPDHYGEPGATSPTTGMAVVDWLVDNPVESFIAVHSLNSVARPLMAARLQDVGYPAVEAPFCWEYADDSIPHYLGIT